MLPGIDSVDFRELFQMIGEKDVAIFQLTKQIAHLEMNNTQLEATVKELLERIERQEK